MQTQTQTKSNPASATGTPVIPNLDAIKAAQRATWEAGDFGEVAQTIEDAAQEFMGRLPLAPGMRVLDAACGTGNLAVHAARAGCHVHGVDIARNLLVQARTRAVIEGLSIVYAEGDVEELPYESGAFDWVVSMFGVMFAPRPETTVAELARVTKPGAQLALANWTPEGFIGTMFKVFKAHLPKPTGLPSPMAWGDEATVRARLQQDFRDLRFNRRIAVMRYPFSPAETVEFFRQYYGPTQRAFAALEPAAQNALRRNLVALQTAANTSTIAGTTEVAAEYLEVIATRTAQT